MMMFDEKKKTPLPSLHPTVWDGLAAALIVLAAVALLLSRSGGTALTAVIWVDGKETSRISLPVSERQEITVSGGGYTLVVVAEGDQVWVESSDCPGLDCVRTGRISRQGQGIVCLPSRISIRLEGAADGVDAVVG